MDIITQIKAEVFDILAEQERLQFLIAQLENLKQQKLQALQQAVEDAKKDVPEQTE